ncbi:MAG: ABC transporter permease [Candidatus Aminicenantes bacterium]|jgi:putative ABC transport system permease protein
MFNLEKEIKKWRKSLNANEALEDGAKEELECHLRDKIEYLIASGNTEEEAFEEALRKIGTSEVLGAEYYRETTRRLSGRPPWKKNRWMPTLLVNYLKIGLRKVKRQKVYSFINIAGLAVGLACCAVIILYVTNELTYDNFHPDADRIYRVATHRISQVGEHTFVTTPGPLAPELKVSYPQVEEAIRVVPPYENADNVLVVRDQKRFFENRAFFVDNAIFEVFHIPFLQGNPQTALTDLNTVVITEGMAQKYFGDEYGSGSILGQVLEIEIDYDTGTVESQDYRVTGIIKNAPANTHFKYDMLLSMPTMISNLPSFATDWINPHWKYAYVKLYPQVDVAGFETQIQRAADIAAKAYTERYDRKWQLYEYFLQPIARIHMHSSMNGEIESPGNWYYLYIYSIVAFLILLIGCMNFINLSAALSTTRTQEVGLRRVVGAKSRQLVGQFLGESSLITLLAFAVGFGLIALLLNPFNRMAGTELSMSGLSQPLVVVSLAALLILVAVGSGGYPAFILTALKPVQILQGKAIASSRGTVLQKFLVVGQFAISIFLVICTLTVFKQLDFMRGRALGLDLDQKLLLRVKSNMNHLRRDYEAIKQDFLQHPSILGATVSSRVPGDRSGAGYYLTNRDGDFQNAPRCKAITVDYDFIPEYGIQMVGGRAFDRSAGNDVAEAYVINLAAVKHLGFSSPDEALGKRFQAHYHRETKSIVGVTDDFHFIGMHDAVEPYILDIENSLFSTITLSIRVENMNDMMALVEKKWNIHFPGVPFEYSFLDENFDRLYRYEAQMSKLLGIITSLGFVIACLGLFGLASFVVRRRTKEIGIRKVLGASTSDIISMLSRKFVFLILASIIIAFPMAFFAINKWLQDFAYRVDLTGFVFVISALGALAIALATVSLQGIRAASANPVNSLRDE